MRSYVVKLHILALLLVGVFATACSQTNSDKVKDAQTCIDNATQATVQNCYNMVSGMTTASAYVIRCSAILVRQGYSNPTTLQSVVSNMQQTTASSPTANAMAILGFHYYSGSQGTPGALDLTDAMDASGQCVNSNSQGLAMLGGLASTATILLQVSSVGNNPAALISYLNGGGAATIVSTYPSVTTSLSTAYSQNCSSGNNSNSAYASFCNEYAAAVSATPGGTNNPTAVTTSFLTNLK